MNNKYNAEESLKKRFDIAYQINNINGCWEWIKTLNLWGYGKITYRDNKKSKEISAHRLSYILNIGKLPKKKLVLHKCDNRKCVNPQHLYLGTQKDNMNDMINKKRAVILKGSQAPWSKLNENDVIEIKKLLITNLSQYKIGKLFNVSRSAILNIKNGSNWKHI